MLKCRSLDIDLAKPSPMDQHKNIVRAFRKIISIRSLYYPTIYTSPLSLTGTVDAKADYPTDIRFLSQKPKRSPLQPIITPCFLSRGLFLVKSSLVHWEWATGKQSICVFGIICVRKSTLPPWKKGYLGDSAYIIRIMISLRILEAMLACTCSSHLRWLSALLNVVRFLFYHRADGKMYNAANHGWTEIYRQQ